MVLFARAAQINVVKIDDVDVAEVLVGSSAKGYVPDGLGNASGHEIGIGQVYFVEAGENFVQDWVLVQHLVQALAVRLKGSGLNCGACRERAHGIGPLIGESKFMLK